MFQFNKQASIPPPPQNTDHYTTVKAQRGALGQEFLGIDNFKALVDNVRVQTTKSSLPEVVGHSFAIRIYRPLVDSGNKLPIMLHFHGGYWCGGNLNSEDLDCRAIIARGVQVIIVSFSYRPVVEVPWRIVFNDAEYAMKNIYSNCNDFSGDASLGFLVSGAESGAHLTAICAVREKQVL